MGFSRMHKQWIPGHISLLPRGLGTRLDSHQSESGYVGLSERKDNVSEAFEVHISFTFLVDKKFNPLFNCPVSFSISLFISYRYFCW